MLSLGVTFSQKECARSNPSKKCAIRQSSGSGHMSTCAIKSAFLLRNYFPSFGFNHLTRLPSPDSDQVALIRQLLCAVSCAGKSLTNLFSLYSSIYPLHALQHAYLLMLLAYSYPLQSATQMLQRYRKPKCGPSSK